MDLTDRLIAALDMHQPDWWIKYAHIQDAQEFMRLAKDYRVTTNFQWERKIASHKRSIATDLFLVIRAGIEAKIVTLAE